MSTYNLLKTLVSWRQSSNCSLPTHLFIGRSIQYQEVKMQCGGKVIFFASNSLQLGPTSHILINATRYSYKLPHFETFHSDDSDIRVVHSIYCGRPNAAKSVMRIKYTLKYANLHCVRLKVAPKFIDFSE